MWSILILSSLLVANAFAASNDTCVVQPQMAMCENYQLPDDEVEANIDDLCTDMPEMPGCTIDNICQSSKYANDIYCVPFSVYKDLCLDMPMMNGCDDYTSMCNVSSVVLECQTPALPLPSTMETESLISSICNQMAMEGCSECTASFSSCDLLTTYSDLCKSMPSMSECSDWKTYCELIPDWPLCSSSGGNSDPIMRMYFHTGFEDYILFKDWVPRSRGQYVGAWFAVFIAGIVFELLRLFRHMCEKEWKKYTHIADSIKFVPFDFRVDVPRAVFRFVEVMLSYSLMLVAMTFNVGLFFAVCAGLSVGTLLFGRFIAWEKQTENATECCS